MKLSTVFLLVIPVLLLACAGSPPEQELRTTGEKAASEEIPKGAMEILEKLEESVRKQDADRKGGIEEEEKEPATALLAVRICLIGELTPELRELLDIGTDKMDQETATGIIVFIENAFVNVGKVKVVDRGISRTPSRKRNSRCPVPLMNRRQWLGGKLAGADIIGSSIAQADSAGGFLEMANQAVYKLF